MTRMLLGLCALIPLTIACGPGGGSPCDDCGTGTGATGTGTGTGTGSAGEYGTLRVFGELLGDLEHCQFNIFETVRERDDEGLEAIANDAFVTDLITDFDGHELELPPGEYWFTAGNDYNGMICNEDLPLHVDRIGDPWFTPRVFFTITAGGEVEFTVPFNRPTPGVWSTWDDVTNMVQTHEVTVCNGENVELPFLGEVHISGEIVSTTNANPDFVLDGEFVNAHEIIWAGDTFGVEVSGHTWAGTESDRPPYSP